MVIRKKISFIAMLLLLSVCTSFLQAQNSLFFRLGGTLPVGKWGKNWGHTHYDASYKEYTDKLYFSPAVDNARGAAGIGGMIEIGYRISPKYMNGFGVSISVMGSMNSMKHKAKSYGESLHVSYKTKEVVKAHHQNSHWYSPWIPQTTTITNVDLNYTCTFEGFHYYNTTLFLSFDYNYSINSLWTVLAEVGVGLNYKADYNLFYYEDNIKSQTVTQQTQEVGNERFVYKDVKKTCDVYYVYDTKSRKKLGGIAPAFKFGAGVVFKDNYSLVLSFIDLGKVQVRTYEGNPENYYEMPMPPHDYIGIEQLMLSLQLGYRLPIGNKTRK